MLRVISRLRRAGGNCGFNSVALLVVLVAGGCGGGGESNGGTSGSGGGNTAATYTIGGNVSGLTGTLVLQNNGSNNLTLTGNSAFTFSTSLASGASYAVTLLTQPAEQNCVVSNGSGTVAAANVSNVSVNCTTLTFKAIGAALAAARADHAATRLADGQVLITGGFNVGTIPAPALDTAELYNPATGAFTMLANRMHLARTNHTATLLSNGQVLLAGGQYNNDDDGHNTAELYDPVTRTFTALTATMVSPRGGHSATLLTNGKVLIAGGFNGGPGTLVSDAELYDPAAQTFTALSAPMATVRNEHSATLLSDGKVLIAGGSDNNDVELNTAELYDPATQTFSAIGATMTSPRAAHAAALRPNGQILLVGGASVFDDNNLAATTALNSAELYDPTTQSFKAISATMTVPRLALTATSLTNDSVLVVGGGRIASGPAIEIFDTAEIYSP